MRLVVALGGNALLRRGEPAEDVSGALGELRAIVVREAGTRIVNEPSFAAV